MNIQSFAHNWEVSRDLCRNAVDRLKYLAWIYDVPRRFSTANCVVHFNFPPPVGSLTLEVRSNGGSDAFIFSEVFLHRYYDFNLTQIPRTILDLGANVGFTTIFFARKYPYANIAAIEPIPRNLAVLRSNLRRNGVSAEVIAKAIAVEDGTVRMQICSNDYGHKIANISYGRHLKGPELKVPAVSVPTLMNELGWDRVGLLKVDIEGYEGVLLRENANWLREVDTLCIELHEGFTLAELNEVAKRFGFNAPRGASGIWVLDRAAKGGAAT